MAFFNVLKDKSFKVLREKTTFKCESWKVAVSCEKKEFWAGLSATYAA